MKSLKKEKYYWMKYLPSQLFVILLYQQRILLNSSFISTSCFVFVPLRTGLHQIVRDQWPPDWVPSLAPLHLLLSFHISVQKRPYLFYSRE